MTSRRTAERVCGALAVLCVLALVIRPAQAGQVAMVPDAAPTSGATASSPARTDSMTKAAATQPAGTTTKTPAIAKGATTSATTTTKTATTTATKAPTTMTKATTTTGTKSTASTATTKTTAAVPTKATTAVPTKTTTAATTRSTVAKPGSPATPAGTPASPRTTTTNLVVPGTVARPPATTSAPVPAKVAGSTTRPPTGTQKAGSPVVAKVPPATRTTTSAGRTSVIASPKTSPAGARAVTAVSRPTVSTVRKIAVAGGAAATGGATRGTAPTETRTSPAAPGTPGGAITVSKTPSPTKGTTTPGSGKPPTMSVALEDHITYQYNALGRRDPYTSLLEGEFVGEDVGGGAPPDLGGLKVVGIMWGSDDQFAMVEDARGDSYVLRRGDKVMNGFVEGLQRDALIVNITVDGQSQSVTVPMTRKGDKTNASR